MVDSGGVIAYPTEGVFGLGCDPLDYYAVSKILQIKKRGVSKGLILIASNLNQLSPYIIKPAQNRWQQVLKTWPGSVSWALTGSVLCPEWIRGAHPTVVVRVSKHPVVKAICDALGYAIVSTSANISSRAALDSAIKVRKALLDVDLIVPGNTIIKGQPSKIYVAATGERLR